MLNKELFLSGIKKLQRSFEFIECKEYYFDIFGSIQDTITDEIFIDACKYIITTTTKEEWNKAYGYKGRPAIADWIKITNRKVAGDVNSEVALLIEKANFYGSNSYDLPKFDNEITKAVAMEYYNGKPRIFAIRFELHDRFNEKRRDRAVVEKELKELWLRKQKDLYTGEKTALKSIETSDKKIENVISGLVKRI
jgi:hypothetical protein